MNVDIFPNADITYDPPPSASALCCYPSFIITPCHPFAMMYGNTGSLLLLSGDSKNTVALFITRFNQECV